MRSIARPSKRAVSAEADALEQALKQAGLDPQATESWPYWNQFADRGLRPTLVMLEKNLAVDENRRTASR